MTGAWQDSGWARMPATEQAGTTGPAETAEAAEAKEGPPSRVCIGARALEGELRVPQGARAVVVFAHGSGSSRNSPRNRLVASILQSHGLATLLFDLLTPEEARDRANVFNIALLARRLTEAIDWVDRSPPLQGLPLGLFGASTGAAAALMASTLRPGRIYAVVSRGGRPDLAVGSLGSVRAPTLLVVGGSDIDVMDLNEQALARMRAPTRLEVVPGATHMFEERGALQRVATLASKWFIDHLPDVRAGELRSSRVGRPSPELTSPGPILRT